MHTDTDTGTTLFVVISIATIVVTGLIAAFCVLASWWLLPVIMVALLGATGAVVAFLGGVMGDDGGHAA